MSWAEGAALAAVLAGWIAINRFILPRLGVST
jgi:hypothetical protein